MECREKFQRFCVCLKGAAFRQLYIENHQIQPAFRSDFGVELPQRTGRRIARVCKECLSPRLPRLVERMKNSFRHKDLSAHNETVRRILQLKRNGADGPQVFCDIFTCHTIAACGTTDKNTVHIFQGHRETVYLGLHGIACMFTAFTQLFVKGVQLLKGEQILQTLQRHLVLHRCEFAHRCSADPLCGRIGLGVLRIGSLQFLQPPQHPVVFKVCDFRPVQHIVEIVVMFQRLTKVLDFFFWLHRCHLICSYST